MLLGCGVRNAAVDLGDYQSRFLVVVVVNNTTITTTALGVFTIPFFLETLADHVASVPRLKFRCRPVLQQAPALLADDNTLSEQLL